MRVKLGVGKKMDGGRLRPGCHTKVFAQILVQSFVQNLEQSSAQKSVPRFEPVCQEVTSKASLITHKLSVESYCMYLQLLSSIERATRVVERVQREAAKL